MKEIILQLAAYNAWANNLLLTAIANLKDEQHLAEVKSSFPSLYQTVLHLLDAESTWWQRPKLQEKIEVPSKRFNGGMQELNAQLQQLDKQWHQWVVAANENALQHEFIYYNSRKERFKQPVYQMLLHLFNHNAYHRGQLITLLRQLGMEKLPETDFIVWSRRKGSA